ncbi:MAG: hypothetical protein R2852_09305 [Bacteroidia bacterium]
MKTNQLPVHAIRESDLADESFTLPKIPKKTTAPSVQLSMAEIVEEADKRKEIDEEDSIVELKDEADKIADGIALRTLDVENVSKAFEMFASKQKVSLVSLIKMLIPKISGNEVTVTMTKQQEEFIGDLKIEWQAFLKSYFKNPKITFNIEIDEKANTKRKAYTAAEQYEELLSENPLFKKMVNQFKLKLKP